jgi:hypothetical protein
MSTTDLIDITIKALLIELVSLRVPLALVLDLASLSPNYGTCTNH